MNEDALMIRLQAVAKERQIQINHCLKLLLLERFLARLTGSSFSNKFIFKGGFLLSYFLNIGRETVDLDFLLTRMKTDEHEIRDAFEKISTTPSTDGFSFSLNKLSPLMQPHMNYPGYRASLEVRFGKIKDRIHIDVGVGDIVTPRSLHLQLFQYQGKPLFEDEVSLLVYPIETIFAEKLEAVISKGAANSRMKDYHDLFLLVNEKKLLDPKKLRTSLSQTFKNRGTLLQPILFDEKGLKNLQKLWTAHLKGLGDIAQKLPLPVDIYTVISTINAYL